MWALSGFSWLPQGLSGDIGAGKEHTGLAQEAQKREGSSWSHIAC